MSRHTLKPVIRHPRRRTLALVLLLCTPLAAFAADPVCVDLNGTPVIPAPGTNQGSEYGTDNATCDPTASAFGYNNNASGTGSIAVGHNNVASEFNSLAVGYSNVANEFNSSAVGSQNLASGYASSAIGAWNVASGRESSAVGYNNVASGDGSSAFGVFTEATGDNAVAMGSWLDLDADSTVDAEEITSAIGTASSAFGPSAQANGYASTAVGGQARADGDISTAIGAYSLAADYGTTAIGAYAHANTHGSTAIGNSAYVNGSTGVALGRQAGVDGKLGVAIGFNSYAKADNSVALGDRALADRASTVSVGAAGSERQIVNVAAASADTDAVILSQLYPFASALGGGASYAGGVFAAPTYVIQGGNFNDVGAAFAAVDGSLTDLYTKVGSGTGPTGPQGPKGDTGPQGIEGPAGGGPRVMVYDTDTRDTVTLKGVAGTVIANVADGAAATDAVNVRQVDQQTRQAIETANSYADSADVATLNSARAYTDQKFAAFGDGIGQFRNEVNDRFNRQDVRMSRMGAMSAASTHMAISAAGAHGNGRLAAGVGLYSGKAALAVGYAAPLGSRANINFGGSVSGKEASTGIGFGIDL